MTVEFVISCWSTMTTEKLVAVAVGGFTVLAGVVAGTWIAGTTLATQDQVHQAVGTGIAPLATKEDVVREVGGIQADLASLPTREEISDIVAAAVETGIAGAIAPLATKEDLAVLGERVEVFDAKVNALIDCITDLDGPRLFASRQALIAGDAADAPGQQGVLVLPNSCERARDLAGSP